jgi:hypothetical protein
MLENKKRGRKAGGLAKFKCSVCGEHEMVRGGDDKFVCSACIDAGHESNRILRGNGGPFAMGLVHRAVSNGNLPEIRECVCVDCGSAAEHYDHRDYNKPLEVDPVCHSCNLRRGPAIPRRGYFTSLFNGELRWFYRRKKDLERLFIAMGLELDLSNVPGSVEFVHWIQFRDVLLDWDRRSAPLGAKSENKKFTGTTEAVAHEL